MSFGFVFSAPHAIRQNRALQKQPDTYLNAGFKLPLPKQTTTILEPVSPQIAKAFREETARIQRRNTALTVSILLVTGVSCLACLWMLTH